MDVAKYFHTLRYLTLTQLYFQLYYKVRAFLHRIIRYKPNYANYKSGHRLCAKTAWVDKPVSYKGDSTFEFLNVTRHFSGSWDSPQYSDLWRYNLNYMDYLLQPEMTFEDGVKWIDCYIGSMNNNSIATAPYPISLRGINWIKFILRHYDAFSEEQLRRIDTALYSQYLILLNSTEKHLMANHYLENGFSLLFAALYFKDKRFMRASEKILRSQLEEQMLSDGAHFELSPMYHCVILERLLDCCNIVNTFSLQGLAEFIHGKAIKMLGWLEAVVMSDGNIPLLNDSAIGIAPLPKDIFLYAKALNLEWDTAKLGESGYRMFKGNHYDAFIDVAELGPSYNLGHSHADTLTFVMNVEGKPYIVDTGTSTYTAGNRRSYERSTEAHNTVVVANKNSSQVWGSFRCAQRANVNIVNESVESVHAFHNGYTSQGVELHRTFTANDTSLVILDEAIYTKKMSAFVAKVHLSPSVSVISASVDKVVTSLGTISFEGALSVCVEPVEVAVSYNQLLPTNCISVSFCEKLKTMILPQKS